MLCKGNRLLTQLWRLTVNKMFSKQHGRHCGSPRSEIRLPPKNTSTTEKYQITQRRNEENQNEKEVRNNKNNIKHHNLSYYITIFFRGQQNVDHHVSTRFLVSQQSVANLVSTRFLVSAKCCQSCCHLVPSESQQNISYQSFGI